MIKVPKRLSDSADVPAGLLVSLATLLVSCDLGVRTKELFFLAFLFFLIVSIGITTGSACELRLHFEDAVRAHVHVDRR